MTFGPDIGTHTRQHSMVSDNSGGGPRDSNGPSKAPAGGKKADRIYPHIDDLVAAKPDINIHAPIRRLLLEGDSYAKAADTNLDFRRPELALQEYIKASIVAVDIIPRHKDFPELMADRSELHRQYSALQKRIISQHAKFEEVKALIKENNISSGIRPTLTEVKDSWDGTTSTRSISRHLKSSSVPNAEMTSNGDGRSFRKKPAIQPKPDSLHGNVITSSRSIPVQVLPDRSAEDLSARFAKLRRNDSSSMAPPAQDPRIRTRFIPMPDASSVQPRTNGSFIQSPLSESLKDRLNRPTGPRDMPKGLSGPPRPDKIRLDIDIPSMPRPPDAIYSPPRNVEDPQRSGLTRPSPHTMYSSSRRSSLALSAAGSRASMSDKRDYFSPMETLSHSSTSRESTAFVLPKSSSVSAEDLMRYLQRGSHELRILLVDIRSREQFDSGHIMSQSIICIEPIAMREAMSAEDLAQSLVLSPEAEQKLFDKRHEFDLLVYYDQFSTSNLYSGPTSNVEEIPLRDFSRAVYDYGYEKQLKRKPMLLIGGLDAWIDLVGLGALKSSDTVAHLPRADITRGPKNQNVPNTLARSNANYITQRRRTYESRPLTQEEESKWSEVLKVEAEQIHKEREGIEVSFARTTEDFFRRFPDPSTIYQQSMISSPRTHEKQPSSRQSSHAPSSYAHHEDDLESMNALMMRAPAAPPPLVARQSISGVAGDVETWSLPRVEPTTITHPIVPRGHTGLWNPQNLCYMNSVIQALSATEWLPRYLLEGRFDSDGPPPRKAEEGSIPPQLMARNLAHLFRHLWSGQYTFVTPKTLRNYVYRVSRGRSQRTADDILGNHQQHDAEEFLGFILEILEDETNRLRAEAPHHPSEAEIEASNRLSVAMALDGYLRLYHRTQSSPITEKFYGHSLLVTKCTTVGCGAELRTWQSFLSLKLNPDSQLNNGSVENLTDLFARSFMGSERISDYRCAKCKGLGCENSSKIAHLPDNLIVHITRYKGNDAKNQTTVRFPVNNLDLSPYVVDMGVPEGQIADPRHRRPFVYDCYAVIQHSGRDLKGGHYWTLVRDQQYSDRWFKFDDSRVYPALEKETQTRESYILFFKRHGFTGPIRA